MLLLKSGCSFEHLFEFIRLDIFGCFGEDWSSAYEISSWKDVFALLNGKV